MAELEGVALVLFIVCSTMTVLYCMVLVGKYFYVKPFYEVYDSIYGEHFIIGFFTAFVSVFTVLTWLGKVFELEPFLVFGILMSSGGLCFLVLFSIVHYVILELIPKIAQYHHTIRRRKGG